MAPNTPQLSQLAEEISIHAKTIADHLKSNNLPQPSFDAEGPPHPMSHHPPAPVPPASPGFGAATHGPGCAALTKLSTRPLHNSLITILHTVLSLGTLVSTVGVFQTSVPTSRAKPVCTFVAGHRPLVMTVQTKPTICSRGIFQQVAPKAHTLAPEMVCTNH